VGRLGPRRAHPKAPLFSLCRRHSGEHWAERESSGHFRPSGQNPNSKFPRQDKPSRRGIGPPEMEAARDSMAALLDAGLFDSAQTLVRNPCTFPSPLQIARVLPADQQRLRFPWRVRADCSSVTGWLSDGASSLAGLGFEGKSRVPRRGALAE
jgi:hypothetical protein